MLGVYHIPIENEYLRSSPNIEQNQLNQYNQHFSMS